MSDENNVETPETSLEAALIGSVQEQAAEAVAESETATEEAYAEAEDQSAPAEEAASAEATEAASAEDDDYRRRLRQFTRELKKQPGQWYIIQCYSGYENKVKTNLDMRAQTLEVEDSIFEVVVPVEQILENKDGKRRSSSASCCRATSWSAWS